MGKKIDFRRVLTAHRLLPVSPLLIATPFGCKKAPEGISSKEQAERDVSRTEIMQEFIADEQTLRDISSKKKRCISWPQKYAKARSILREPR